LNTEPGHFQQHFARQEFREGHPFLTNHPVSSNTWMDNSACTRQNVLPDTQTSPAQVQVCTESLPDGARHPPCALPLRTAPDQVARSTGISEEKTEAGDFLHGMP